MTLGSWIICRSMMVQESRPQASLFRRPGTVSQIPSGSHIEKIISVLYIASYKRWWQEGYSLSQARESGQKADDLAD